MTNKKRDVRLRKRTRDVTQARMKPWSTFKLEKSSGRVAGIFPGSMRRFESFSRHFLEAQARETTCCATYTFSRVTCSGRTSSQKKMECKERKIKEKKEQERLHRSRAAVTHEQSEMQCNLRCSRRFSVA